MELQFEFKGLLAEFPPLLGRSVFALPDWVRPTHTMGGNLLYSKSADLNINLT